MTDDFYWDEINWRLQPRPERSLVPDGDPSTPDLVGMMTADVMAQDAHLSSVTADLATYRELVQTCLDRIAALTAQLKAKDARLLDQAQQIRAFMDRNR